MSKRILYIILICVISVSCTNKKEVQENEESPLLKVVKQDNVKQVSQMLAEIESADEVNVEDKERYTPLFYASRNGNIEIVTLLVENGANVNAVNKYGGSPLLEASYMGNFSVVKYLVEQGADMTHQDYTARTALSVAVAHNNPQQLEVVKYLIDQGIDINVLDVRDTPVIIFACGNKDASLDIIKYLVEEQNVDINQGTEDGITALMIATQMDNLQVVSYLVEQGADINAQTADAKTVFDYAKRNGEVMPYLETLQ